MIPRRLLLPAIALGPLVAGQPAGQNIARQDALDKGHAVVYDSTVTKPTLVPAIIHFVDEAGAAVGSAAEDVLVLPTGESSNESSHDRIPKDVPLSSPGAFSSPQDDRSSPGPARPEPVQGARGARGPGDSVKSATPAVQAAGGRAKLDSKATSHLQSSSGSDATSHASSRFGVTYNPYRADKKCKSQQEIQQDFERFGKSYSTVRIYGTDCNQVPMVRAAAEAHNMKIVVGTWDPTKVVEESRKIIEAFHGNWTSLRTVSVGNELVHKDPTCVNQVVRAIYQARSILRRAGFEGPVVIVDTPKAYLDHPELGQASDCCAINAHPFFNPRVEASQAGTFVYDTVKAVERVCQDSKCVSVTETGWPTQGDSNGLAIPGVENQKLAIQSIKLRFATNHTNVIFHSALDDLWKPREKETFNAEPYWGISLKD